MAGSRVDDVGRAERINAAAGLLAAGMAPVEAAGVVAQRFSVSVRLAVVWIATIASWQPRPGRNP